MKIHSKIAAAVAASLVGVAANAANAPLNYAQIAAATPIFASGSSAITTNLEAQLSSIATFGGANNTLTKFADSLDGKSFLAYSFTVPNPAPADFAGVAGKNILLLYRTKGGSVWGPGPIAKTISTATLATPTAGNCGAA